MTENHKKIMTDLKELGLTCGIAVTGVFQKPNGELRHYAQGKTLIGNSAEKNTKVS